MRGGSCRHPWPWMKRWLACAGIALQAASALRVDDDASTLSFKAWLTAHNASIQFDWPVETATGRSAVASRALAVGEPICDTPGSLLMTTLAYDADAVLSRLDPMPDVGDDYKQRLKLALVLLRERALGPASAWAPYLAILPREPVHAFTEAEKNEFHDNVLVQAFRDRLRDLRSEFDAVVEQLQLFDDAEALVPSLDEWTWAREIVDTRAFTLRDVLGLPSLFVFVPGCDLLNHSPDGQWGWQESDGKSPNPWVYGGRITAYSTKPVPQGREVFISYGDELSNFYLVLVHGFVRAHAERVGMH